MQTQVCTDSKCPSLPSLLRNLNECLPIKELSIKGVCVVWQELCNLVQSTSSQPVVLVK